MSKEKSNKTTILIFNEYYLPGYKAGGPIRSISNIVSWLGDEFQFKIATKDRDSFEKEPYQGIKVNEWNKVGKAEVFYIAEKDLGFRKLYKILKQTDYDAIYFNSVFNFWFSVIPLFLAAVVLNVDPSKVLLIPRGELSDGALVQKTFKKKLFLTVLNILGIHKKINWQATNKEERKEIKQHANIPSEQICLASNLPQKVSNEEFKWVEKKEASLKIVYLSRVTPKKNLDFALDVLSEIRDVNLSLDIYGIIDDQKYWEKCQKKIDKQPTNVTVKYVGVIQHDKVVPTLSTYHLFLFPTKGENFGHAIYEAMLSGTPVLISDQTPWKNLAEKNMGWDISLGNRSRFKEVIRKLAVMNMEQINNRKREVKKAIFDYNIENTLKNNQRLFSNLIG